MQRGLGSKGTGLAGSAAAGAGASAGGSRPAQRGVDSGFGGYNMMSEDEQPNNSAADAGLKGAVKRTRVEGR